MVVAVTRPDKRRSRGAAPSPTPVSALAGERGIPVVHSPAACLDYGAELGIVVAFGRIIAGDVLDRLEMVNVHFSLLPRWRGAAPVERAILAGDPTTGVCLMRVEEGLDTGGVYRSAETAIGVAETSQQLTERLAALGAGLLVEALGAGLGDPRPQEGEATYAAKIASDDLRLDWARPTSELSRVVRLGRAWTVWRGQRLLVHSAEPASGRGTPGTVSGDKVYSGDSAIRLLKVQPQGKQVMAGAAWLRGVRPVAGEAFDVSNEADTPRSTGGVNVGHADG